MLTRFRIEVQGADSAAACEEELAKYEHALQVTEADRYGITDADGKFRTWGARAEERHFYNPDLGREVTDEVIEYDVGLPGYRGRRVVQLRRTDTRHATHADSST